MNKSLILASLVAAIALAACGKKEEATPAAAAARCRNRPGCCRRFGRGSRLPTRPRPLSAGCRRQGRRSAGK